VVVGDISTNRLELARAQGAVLAINTRSDDALIAVRAGAEAPRAVIDFVGSSETVDFALRAVGKGGIVVVVGLYGGSMELSTVLLPMRNVTLRGSYVGTLQEMRELLMLLEHEPIFRVPIFPSPMSEINERLEDLRTGRLFGRAIAMT
jgi:D-arabinose 1-dehydrogenase-like Zn-dependent alcohol dehydrogenase